MRYHIESRNLREQPTLLIRAMVPVAEVSTWLPQTYARLFGHLEKVDVPPVGPPYARYILGERTFDIEAGVPVAGPVPVPQGGPLRMGSLPAGPAVATFHVGPYDSVGDAVDALDAWLEKHGYEAAGPHWENYFTDPVESPDPATWRTEVIRPHTGWSAASPGGAAGRKVPPPGAAVL